MEKFLLHCLKQADNKLAAQVIMQSGQMYVGAINKMEGFEGVYQVTTPVQTSQSSPPTPMPVVFRIDHVSALMPVDERLLASQDNGGGGIVLDGN